MSAIKKGDLVAVVRGVPCCGYPHRIGLHFIVGKVVRESASPFFSCRYCRTPEREATVVYPKGESHSYYIETLKKIDPPAKGETTEAYKSLPVKKAVPTDEETAT